MTETQKCDWLRSEYEALMNAQIEKNTVKRKNYSTVVANAKIKLWNKKLRCVQKLIRSGINKLNEDRIANGKPKVRMPLLIPAIPLNPLPHRLSRHAELILNRAKQAKARLGTVKPEEWKCRIERLDNPARHRVACLVWWDWFGGRTQENAWHHLDQYVESYKETTSDEFEALVNVDPKLVALGLHSVGYGPAEAWRRGTTYLDEES